MLCAHVQRPFLSRGLCGCTYFWCHEAEPANIQQYHGIVSQEIALGCVAAVMSPLKCMHAWIHFSLHVYVQAIQEWCIWLLSDMHVRSIRCRSEHCTKRFVVQRAYRQDGVCIRLCCSCMQPACSVAGGAGASGLQARHQPRIVGSSWA